MTHAHEPRDVVPPPAVPGQPGPPTVGADADPVAPEAAVVPPQESRPRRDAFDLYAQIYALRTGSTGSTGSPSGPGDAGPAGTVD